MTEATAVKLAEEREELDMELIDAPEFDASDLESFQ